MKRITRVRARLRRLSRKRKRWFEKFKGLPVGTPKRARAKAVLGKLRGFYKAREAELKKLLATAVDWNGHPGLPRLRREVKVCLNHNCYVTSTSEGYPGDGVHTPSSYHYQARAVDIGGSYTDLVASQNALVNKFGVAHFTELFGPDNFYVKNGVRIAGFMSGHGDHVHIAK